VTRLFVWPLIARLLGGEPKQRVVNSRISEPISSNHGRAEYIAVVLEDGGAIARPIKGKSGLIAGLARTDGYIRVSRDVEGLPKNADAQVILWN
jgi:molybdopterin molybdotransferase